jgi:hypothetical protein
MYIGLHAMCPLFLSDFNAFSRQIFENTHVKFNENPSKGSRVVSCGWVARRADT